MSTFLLQVQYSQIRTINPELREITYVNDSNLEEQLYIDSLQQEAFQEALEMMDLSFSIKYRIGISKLLVDKVTRHAGIVDYLINKLYSNSLPPIFHPDKALGLLHNAPDNLKEVFKDLRFKTSLFDRFYTLFKTRLLLADNQIVSIDQRLTNSGSYAHFTLALYNKSLSIYNYASSLAIEELLGICENINLDFFKDLRSELDFSYNIKLNADSELNITKSKLIRIQLKHYRFFESSLKTVFNFYNSKFPFTAYQCLDILSINLSFEKTEEETYSQFKWRLYDQTVSELQFLEKLNPELTAHIKTNSNNAQELFTVISEPNERKSQIELQRETLPNLEKELFYSLVLADSMLLNAKYDHAFSLYIEILNWYRYETSHTINFQHLIKYMVISMRLTKSFELMNHSKESSSLFVLIKSLLTSDIPNYLNKSYEAETSDFPVSSNILKYVNHILQNINDFRSLTRNRNFISAQYWSKKQKEKHFYLFDGNLIKLEKT